MAALFAKEKEPHEPDRQRIRRLFVDGVPYANTAAKFWPSLLDEILEEHPDAPVVELAASIPGDLTHDHLFPALALQSDLTRLLTEDVHRTMKDLLAEMELTGPPASVVLRLLDGGREILVREMPTECLDSDVFPFLLAWPLRWAGVPESRWNENTAEGEFEGADRDRGFLYRIRFSLAATHLSEGLYRRTITVAYSREPLASPPPDATNATAP